MISAVCLSGLVLVLVSPPPEVCAHGYLYDPPSRSSLWRHGFDVEANFDDNALYCGGKQVQWGLNGGECGFCGDRFDGPRHNEAGGKYARGIISRNYTQDGILPITVILTAPHGGWFEFRLCPNNDVTKAVTQECLDMHLLGLAKSPDSTRFDDVSKGGSWATNSVYKLEYQLPPGLTCDQCVLQWKYNTGKDWGCQEGTNICAVGLGPQEQFYGCADIAILPRGDGRQTTTTTARTTTTATVATTRAAKPSTTTLRPTTTTKPTTSARLTSRQKTETSTKPTARVTSGPTNMKTFSLPKTTTATTRKPTTATTATTTTKRPETRERCRGAGIFRGTVMDNRCVYMCQMGTCPEVMCTEACRKLFSGTA